MDVMKYYCLENDDQQKFCVLGEQPDDVEDVCFLIIDGEPVGSDYPDNAKFKMSEHSGGIVAPDFVRNTLGYFFVSERFRDLLEKLNVLQSVEYLPAIIINHKGRAITEKYSIMNILGCHDCLDKQATEGEIDELEPQFYQWIDKLVLSDAKVEDAPHLFRVESFPGLLLVSEWLKSQIIEAGLTGMDFIPTGIDYQFN